MVYARIPDANGIHPGDIHPDARRGAAHAHGPDALPNPAAGPDALPNSAAGPDSDPSDAGSADAGSAAPDAGSTPTDHPAHLDADARLAMSAGR